MKAFEYAGAGSGQRQGDPDPGRGRRPGAGVPREADGRGGRELRRADGALPRGRGDLARRDRRRAQGRRHRGHDLPGHLRRGDQEPRHRPAARRAGQRPAVAGARRARRPRATGTATRSRSSRTRTASPVAYVFKTLADPFAGRINLFRVYSGIVKHDSQLTNVRAHTKERIGQLLVPQGKEMGHADEFGAGDIGAVAKLKETHSGDVLADQGREHLVPAARPARRGDGVRDRGQGEGRRGEGRRARCAASRRRTRRSTSTATRRPASRSSPACRRCTSR